MSENPGNGPPAWLNFKAAPLQETLGIGGQGAHAGFSAVGDDQHFVVLEQVGDLFLVGLNLVVGLPEVGKRRMEYLACN